MNWWEWEPNLSELKGKMGVEKVETRDMVYALICFEKCGCERDAESRECFMRLVFVLFALR